MREKERKGYSGAPIQKLQKKVKVETEAAAPFL